MANFSALNQLSLVFLSYPKVSGNRKKPKRYYMADGGWIWWDSWIFDFFYWIFFQKIQHKVLDPEIQFILSIFCVWHLKISPNSTILQLKLEKHEFQMS